MSTGSSAHPVDRLIRRTIQTGVRPSDADVRAIVNHVARASFGRQLVRMDTYYQRLAVEHGFHVPLETDAQTAHVAKHVWAQEQWVVTTTIAHYLEDVRAAVAASSSKLVVYARRRRPFVAAFAPTVDVVPISRRGPAAGECLLVVYSPDNAMIVTAYMIDGMQDADVPAGAVWLR